MAEIGTRALITISEARNYLADEEADAERLADLINSYSLAVRGFCQRQFYREDALTKTFGYEGSGSLDLAPFELRVLTSLTVAGTALVEDQAFQLHPVGGSDEGTWWKVLFAAPYGSPSIYHPEPRFRFGYTVAVEGDWGTPEIPEPAKMATKIAVANGYRNPEGYSSRTSFGVTGEEILGQVAVSRELPEDAKGILEDAGLVRMTPILAP